MTTLSVAGTAAGVTAVAWVVMFTRSTMRRVERPLAIRRDWYEEAGWRFRVRVRPQRHHRWTVTARLPVAGSRHIVVRTETSERQRAWQVTLNGIRRDEVGRHAVTPLPPPVPPPARPRRAS